MNEVEWSERPACFDEWIRIIYREWCYVPPELSLRAVTSMHELGRKLDKERKSS